MACQINSVFLTDEVIRKAVLNLRGSKMYVRQMIAVTVPCIIHQRTDFDRSSFVTRNINNISCQIFRQKARNPFLISLTHWITGAFDALAKNYLRDLYMMFCSKDDPNKIIEMYKFHLEYLGSEALHLENSPTRIELRQSTDTLLKGIKELGQFQELKIEKVTVKIAITYYENVVPADYRPSYYKICTDGAADAIRAHFSHYFDLGTLNTGFDIIKCRAKGDYVMEQTLSSLDSDLLDEALEALNDFEVEDLTVANNETQIETAESATANEQMQAEQTAITISDIGHGINSLSTAVLADNETQLSDIGHGINSLPTQILADNETQISDIGHGINSLPTQILAHNETQMETAEWATDNLQMQDEQPAITISHIGINSLSTQILANNEYQMETVESPTANEHMQAEQLAITISDSDETHMDTVESITTNDQIQTEQPATTTSDSILLIGISQSTEGDIIIISDSDEDEEVDWNDFFKSIQCACKIPENFPRIALVKCSRCQHQQHTVCMGYLFNMMVPDNHLCTYCRYATGLTRTQKRCQRKAALYRLIIGYAYFCQEFPEEVFIKLTSKLQTEMKKNVLNAQIFSENNGKLSVNDRLIKKEFLYEWLYNASCPERDKVLLDSIESSAQEDNPVLGESSRKK